MRFSGLPVDIPERMRLSERAACPVQEMVSEMKRESIHVSEGGREE